MPCPTCDHTLAGVGESGGDPVRHCPRCGTVVVETDPPRVYTPWLVGRCRHYEKRVHNPHRMTPDDPAVWHSLGVAEAINKPGDRP